MMPRNLSFSLIILLGAVLVVCDRNALDEADTMTMSRLAIDLRSLNCPTNTTMAQLSCVSVVHEVVLTVNRKEVCRKPVELGAQNVSCPVEVERGEVTFVVTLVSENETVLFSDTLRESITGDGFSINLAPQAVAPVLRVCYNTLIDTLIISPTGTGTLLVSNVGIDTLQWDAMTLENLCGDQPCLSFSPEWYNTEACSTDVLVVRSTVAGTYDVPITSAEGEVRVHVVVR